MAFQGKPYLREVSLKREDIENDQIYPFTLPAVRSLSSLELHPDVTFLVGENGSGKSTLLEGIAVAWGFNAEGGTINFNFSTRSSHSELHEYLRLVRSSTRPRDGFFLRAESFFNVATDIDRLNEVNPLLHSYGCKSLHEQSHGESFMSLMLHRFGGNGLYILDEPEAALSPSRQLAVLRRIYHLVQSNSQFIIATHSPILMAYPGARIILLGPDGFVDVRYEETEHYAVTKKFLNNSAQMIKDLFED